MERAEWLKQMWDKAETLYSYGVARCGFMTTILCCCSDVVYQSRGGRIHLHLQRRCKCEVAVLPNRAR